jgi:endoglucanase
MVRRACHLLLGLGLSVLGPNIATAGQASLPAPNPIRLNQAGLLGDAPQRALLPSAQTAPLPWQLRDGSGQIVATGKTQPLGHDAAAGQNLHLVDFTGNAQSGDGFTLQVGNAISRPFSIGKGPYDALKRDALAYFYHNRAGIPIEARFVGATWARPAGHEKEIAPCFAGTDNHGNRWPACRHQLDVTGGWYDAGDHGKYVVNGGISLWTLLNLYERQAARGIGPAFPDGAASIPEAGNGVNDLLDEARWEIAFMLSMQVPEGTRMGLPLGRQKGDGRLVFTEVDVSGMAHHKVADEHWTKLPMPPHLDKERRFLYPPSTAATLNLAATAAQAARIWRKLDPAFADRCLTAARRAWVAALRVPDAYAIGDFNGSGGYGDPDVSDEFFWAATELLATTQEPAFADALHRSPHFSDKVAREPGWGSTATLGLLSLSLNDGALPATEARRVKEIILAGADQFLTDGTGSGYRQPLAANKYEWGSNSTLLNRAIVLAYAFDQTNEPRFRDAVADVGDYLLGRNPLDQSYISGYGARPMRHPHHRFWAQLLDPSLPPPPPGVLSGGPNGDPGDVAMQRLGGSCAPQTCWLDAIDLFTLNEVTINWNAPLVWVAAWLDEGR